MKHNLPKHEAVGLFLVFAGASWLGFALYATFVIALRFVVPGFDLIGGWHHLMFPLYWGVGALMFVLGKIELREALPGKNRR